MDIELDKVAEKSFQENLAQTTEKTRAANILVNTNLKRLTSHSNWAIVVKEIPVRTLAEAVHIALSEFGSTDLVAARWFILIEKDFMKVVKANIDKESWNIRDQHKILLYILLMGINAYNIWDFIGSVSGKTCVINQHSVIYAQVRCAVVCFDFAVLLNAVMKTTSYTKCENLGYTSLSYSIGENVSLGGPFHRILLNNNKNRLAFIYARRSVSISHSVSFGGAFWANIVGGFSFSPLFIHNGLAASGSFSKIKPNLIKFEDLNNRFATFEHSLISLAECIDKLAKRLNTFGPMVSQSSLGCQPLSSGVITCNETITEVVVFDLSVISKIEEILNNISMTVMGLLAKIDNADLTRKQIAPNFLPAYWSNQYAPLDYVRDNAFSNVINVIGSDEFLLVIKSLFNGKAAGISGIPNELWKHRDAQILGGLLDILNICLVLGAVSLQWKQAWISMIPKLYD
ncbi:hypothetical protein G9A89_006158 [Geosiphon pyriformis]|nr:hypothetical protein G9A89_006158 [Geosiphon pyriformis]